MRNKIAFSLLVLLIAAVGALSQPVVTALSQPGQPMVAQQPEQTVDVSLFEWGIAAQPNEIPAGTVAFVARNDGTMTHALAIVGLNRRTPNLSPGGSATLIVNLGPGIYTLFCPVDRHSERGMVTTITVR